MFYASKGYSPKMSPQQGILDEYQGLIKYINESMKVIDISDFHEREKYKRTQAYYFIMGHLKDNYRNNANLTEKKLIAIDYECLDMSLKDFYKQIHNAIGNYRYVLYPSIHCFNKVHSDGTTDNRFRYRLVIDTDRAYTQGENERIIINLTTEIGLDYDKKSESWSQAMGLPILTPHTRKEMIITNEGIPVRIDDYLTPIKSKRPPNSIIYTASAKKYTATFMEEIIEGVAEGNRNNWITSIVGKLFYLGMEHEAIYRWLWLINENCIFPPLSDNEINNVFRSILTKEAKKRGIE